MTLQRISGLLVLSVSVIVYLGNSMWAEKPKEPFNDAAPRIDTGASSQLSQKPVVLMEGVVLEEGSLKPIGATIELFDPTTHEKMNSYKSNSMSGAYTIVLKPSEHFIFRISSKGYVTAEVDICTPLSEKYEHVTRNFSLKPLPLNS
ncbi:MAG TPA: hypothetical protein VFA55_05660 [Candidatus Kapabacteria bacterium]|nr:hypothetical protein [Candidatus Kapabacteria bacterium]